LRRLEDQEEEEEEEGEAVMRWFTDKKAGVPGLLK
jgi:hypothetical protein